MRYVIVSMKLFASLYFVWNIKIEQFASLTKHLKIFHVLLFVLHCVVICSASPSSSALLHSCMLSCICLLFFFFHLHVFICSFSWWILFSFYVCRKWKICRMRQSRKFMPWLTLLLNNSMVASLMTWMTWIFMVLPLHQIMLVMMVVLILLLYHNYNGWNIMVTIGKAKRFLEAKKSQCHNMGFLCNKQCFNHPFKDKFKPSWTWAIEMCFVLTCWCCTCRTLKGWHHQL